MARPSLVQGLLPPALLRSWDVAHFDRQALKVNAWARQQQRARDSSSSSPAATLPDKMLASLRPQLVARLAQRAAVAVPIRPSVAAYSTKLYVGNLSWDAQSECEELLMRARLMQCTALQGRGHFPPSAPAAGSLQQAPDASSHHRPQGATPDARCGPAAAQQKARSSLRLAASSVHFWPAARSFRLPLAPLPARCSRWRLRVPLQRTTSSSSSAPTAR